jgi:two-component system sensor histidine kinase CpxA
MRVAAEYMAQGHFDRRLDIERSDEIGSLATSLNHLATRLEEFVMGKKQFLGDIAHELGSPLARLQYAVAIMESQARPEMQPILDDVREEVAQMAALLQEILQFTKAGLQSELHMQPVELSEALEHVLLQENIPHEQISSQLEEGLSVLADPLYLRRAIANVLRNSLRYAEGSGPILLEARREKDEVLLRISDKGPGVPPELVHRLCDPFFRTESARTRETGGVGLGLSIVKRCVEACGGTVLLRNLAPHGLAVEMRLPASQNAEG